MKYSDELIKEVKEVYPTFKEAIKAAEDGNIFLGRYLDDSCSNSLPLKLILQADTLEKLQSCAKVEQRKFDLYLWWNREYMEEQNKETISI